MAQRTYKNIVFTKHAAERMALRSITQHSIWETITYPHQVRCDKKDTKKYIKTIRGRKYFAVASKLPKENTYVVVSTWVRGEDDKPPLVWILITTPFKIFWKVMRFVIKKIASL